MLCWLTFVSNCSRISLNHRRKYDCLAHKCVGNFLHILRSVSLNYEIFTSVVLLKIIWTKGKRKNVTIVLEGLDYLKVNLSSVGVSDATNEIR